MKLMLKDSAADPVRFAFAHIFSKRPGMQNDDGTKSKDKFELTPIIKPGGANAKAISAAIEAVAKEKYGDKPTKDDDGNTVPMHKAVLAAFEDDQAGLRKGNRKKTKDGSVYAGFEDMLYVVAKNETRPTVIDRDRKPLVEEDGRPYSGCYGNVSIDIWALNKPGMKKRIVMDLLGVQFTRDGDAFGAGSAPAKPDDFDDLSAEGDDADGMLD